MITKVLVAFDGSDPSKRAFDFGLDIAHKYSAELLVLSVVRLPEPPVDVETESLVESGEEYYGKLYEELREKAAAIGATPRFEVVIGHPAEQIIHKAEVEKVDLIVMGHRGKTFVARWLLGSVSKRVLSYAHCAVTIVR
jgi:nucleotide-binding universal stress UspA family protein